MGLLDSIFNRNNLDEAIDKYKDKGDAPLTDAQKGEGWEFLPEIPGVGNVGLQSFNVFYKSYINIQYKNELERIKNYRSMARNTEVADVIEDAVNESTQEDADGTVLKLEIKDKELATNENIVNNLHAEFEELFSKRIRVNDILWDLIRTFYIDGRVFFEKIIDSKNEKKGLINIKRLPTETMDYIYDPFTGEIQAYFQYLKLDSKKPLTIDEALKRDDVTVFYPEQICFINYGIFGKTRYEIEGYLEKAKIPYNQLKLLETSVIIYRIVRAPERLVFRIDTGNMPRDKALKYVEKIKQKMTKKQTYDPATGQLTQAPEVLSILENYYMPQSADGRGSTIDSIGGNAAGFTELDDIYYFARKMYRSLKYPASRVTAGQEKQDADNMFGGSNTGEISRDEIKWAKFLARNQRKFENEMTDLFLLHLEFKGLKKQYGLNRKKIKASLTPPSNYKEQMEQNFLESRFNNYSTLADRPEMSKYFLMKKFLKWDDQEIKDNVAGRKMDEKFGFNADDGGFSDKRLKKEIKYI